MRRAILCGVLILAGCGRPTLENQAGEQGTLKGLPNPTAESRKQRELLSDVLKAARQVPGDAASQGPPPADEMILDANYTPRQEDRATLIGDAIAGFSRASLFDEIHQSPEREDRDRLRAMIDRGELVELEENLPVLVVRNLAPADAREPGRQYGVEVRILEGTRKGETWFVDESAVGRLVPKVVHPPLAPGSYATVARSGTIAYAGWEALDPAASSTGDAAKQEAFRLDEGIRVIVLEGRGEAVRIRVTSATELADRVGIVNRSDLRPIVPQSSP